MTYLPKSTTYDQQTETQITLQGNTLGIRDLPLTCVPGSERKEGKKSNNLSTLHFQGINASSIKGPHGNDLPRRQDYHLWWLPQRAACLRHKNDAAVCGKCEEKGKC